MHRLDARAKLLAVIAYCAVLVSFGRYETAALAPMVVGPMAMLWLGNVPMWFALRRVLVLSPFIATVALAGVLLDHRPAELALGPWHLATTAGVLTTINVCGKFILAVLALTALMSTTPFALLLEAARRLRTPRLLVMQLGFLYRYLFVLIDEAMRIRRGRDLRGAALARPSRRLAAVGGVIGTLLARTLERSERVELAMALRGGGDKPPATLDKLTMTAADWLVLAASAAYLGFCRGVYPLVAR